MDGGEARGGPPVTAERSRIMAAIRGKDTGPEMRVRRFLHAAGLRYGLHGKGLPGRPDIVLRRHRAVVFVHGCFWHGHSCKAGRLPRTRTEWWRAKIGRNRDRDAGAEERLARMGWRVFVVWECGLRDPAVLPALVAGIRGAAEGTSRVVGPSREDVAGGG